MALWARDFYNSTLGSPTGRGATPQSEGLVRARTQVCFHTPAPVHWGRSRSINPYAGRRFERRFEAADHPFADRPAVWQPGITEQGRGTPDGSGHSPSRQVRDAPVPSDRWPSRTGLLDLSTPVENCAFVAGENVTLRRQVTSL